MLAVLIFFAVCFLAYANGANDDFKGAASLFGSRTCGHDTAISWATLTTFAGSVTALFLAQTLIRTFSGQGLVPDPLVASTPFVLAVASGAGATVLLATWLGFPISTTHGMTGAGLASSLHAVNVALLGKTFARPLLISPLLAVVTGGLVYVAFRFARLRLGVTKEMCVCAGVEQRVVPLPPARRRVRGAKFADPFAGDGRFGRLCPALQRHGVWRERRSPARPAAFPERRRCQLRAGAE